MPLIRSLVHGEEHWLVCASPIAKNRAFHCWGGVIFEQLMNHARVHERERLYQSNVSASALINRLFGDSYHNRRIFLEFGSFFLEIPKMVSNLTVLSSLFKHSVKSLG